MTTRRAFLSDFGLGMTGMALGAMLADDGVTRAAESAARPAEAAAGSSEQLDYRPRAKSVIWVVFVGWIQPLGDV